MNSIRRPRKRPRVRSVSWHPFSWLLLREAFVGLVSLRRQAGESELALRRWLCTVPSDRVRELGEQVLRRHPDWRIK